MAWRPVKNGVPVRGVHSLTFQMNNTSNLSSLKKSRWGMSTLTELCREAGL